MQGKKPHGTYVLMTVLTSCTVPKWQSTAV